MDNPFFSVIVTEHNSAEFMRKGLDSIREQSFKDYELIVICDKCTDNTAEIAREYTDNVIEVDYGRAGLARNEGLDRARGEWVLWMDDDDWFLHEFVFQILAEQLVLLDPEVDILAFSFIWKYRGYAQNRPGNLWIAIWNKAWKRSFIGDTRFPDWEHSDDKGFAQATHGFAHIAYWDMPMYYYNYMRPGSISQRLSDGELK